MNIIWAFVPMFAFVAVIMLSTHFDHATYYKVAKFDNKFIVVKQKGYTIPTLLYYMTDEKIEWIKEHHPESAKYIPWGLLDKFAIQFDTVEEAKAFAKTVKAEDKARRKAKKVDWA